ncbi:PAS domain S-box protein [Cyclobacterium jeungdonense]|uniref:histidine kinase n=1 Tax=Cyclobacterium jeungdonense TaxID=708087 RepID=A0ABT8C779_9BACT|nr:PAS domain S-box protein [Cyclobacterium jeungdonense]MDN3687663.1 PAS domain S-box protein [Cyclobacterium jeungdonense]
MYKSTFGTGDEEKRLEVLNSYAILDSPPEQEWDALTELAARVSGTGISFLSFFGEATCFTMAAFGLTIEEINGIPSLCRLGLEDTVSPVIIKDTRELNVVVASEHAEYRFFARFLLVSPNGFLLGSLCVLDQNPSVLNEGQVRSLELLTAQAITLLENRKKQRVLQQSFRLHRDLEKQRALDRLNNDALINTTSDDIWSIDNNQKLIAFNKAFATKMEHLIGFKVFPGSPALFPEKIPEDMHQRFKTFFARALAGESFTETYCRPEKLKSGMEIWIELSAHPIREKEKITGAAFFARTISERKLAELKIKESETNYRMLFDLSPLPKMLLDVDTLEILEINQAALLKYGYERAEISGYSMGILFQQEEVAVFYESIQKLGGKKGASKLDPVIHVKKNGELIQGELFVHELVYKGRNCMMAILNDQTEQLQTLSLKSQMATIMENSLNEIYIFDTESLHFSYANRGALLNMGYSLEELRKLAPYNIKPEFKEQEFRDFLQPLLSDREEKLVFVTVHERKDGSRYPVEVHLQKMRYEGDSAMVAVIIDITETKKTEQKLVELNELLEKSNRELEQFASITAHDLQEPLRMVSGFTSLIKKKYEGQLDEKGLQYIHFAMDGSIRMQQMIKDILEFSKAGKGLKRMEHFSLMEVLDPVLNDLKSRIESKGANVEIPPQDLPLHGHQNSIYRLFLNLISNALKFIPKDKSPEVRIRVRQDREKYHFTIEDNGIGISPKDLPKLFQPFNRLHNKQAFEGTGLGLATCKKIVVNHGGEIWITSSLGEGSQFHFTMPKSTDD